MRPTITISRIITGLTFIFSGFVKAVDPLGSTYKFQDYFQAFNIEFLKDLALPLAIILCTAEFISGFSVLTGIRLKAGIYGIMILMIIFTPITFILALSNPVTDCGCFGDAIHLTNWQTFYKNLILLIPAIVLFINRNKIKGPFAPLKEWIIAGSMICLFVLFNIYNLRYLPVIDFLPYKKGVKIADKMAIPENAPADKYSTTFIYMKEGVTKEFDLTNYPAEDTTWKFIDQKTVLLEKGYTPPIHDFTLTTTGGDDITGDVLSYEGKSVFMISKKLDQVTSAQLAKGYNLGKYCLNNGIRFYVLTASGSDEIMRQRQKAIFCTVDETTLKTMIRSNPGYMLLENGTIKGKWSWAGLPDTTSFGNIVKK
jgi:uncharacterized membrane protein YphA (DoxX/SURF4 family)